MDGLTGAPVGARHIRFLAIQNGWLGSLGRRWAGLGMLLNMSQARSISFVAGVVVLLLAVGGCVEWRLAPRLPLLTGQENDIFVVRPVAMRVFPSTRLVTEDGQPMLDARIEFLDAAGDSTKAVGWIRIDLHPLYAGTSERRGRLLYRWDQTVLTLDENRRFYDPVTRTYLFRLMLDGRLPAGDPLELAVYFKPVEGDPLEATFTLNTAE